MRDRLIELLKQKVCPGPCFVCEYYDAELKRPREYCAAESKADHLLANGVVVPPCKVGATVWFELYGQIEAAVIYHCTYESSHRGFFLSGAYAKDTRGLELSFVQNSLGKTVFLSREEAEQTLKGEHHG